MTAIRTADELLTMVDGIDGQAVAYEHRKLLAIREWALGRIGIDYRTGDRVRIKDDYEVHERFADGHHNGWWPYRDCLVPGALATAGEIDFNAVHGYWYADITLDREFSTYEISDEFTHFWHGPVASTPEGMKPPTAFDQEHYPNGRRHLFSFDATQLELAGGDETNG